MVILPAAGRGRGSRACATWHGHGCDRRRSWLLPGACAAGESSLCGYGAGESQAGGWVRTCVAPELNFAPKTGSRPDSAAYFIQSEVRCYCQLWLPCFSTTPSVAKASQSGARERLFVGNIAVWFVGRANWPL